MVLFQLPIRHLPQKCSHSYFVTVLRPVQAIWRIVPSLAKIIGIRPSPRNVASAEFGPLLSPVLVENGPLRTLGGRAANGRFEPILAALKLAEIMKRCNPSAKDSEGAPECQK
jgi:hypothetical protein